MVIHIYDEEGEIRAALCAITYTKNISDFLDISKFDGVGYYHLIDSNGRYIAYPEDSLSFLMDETYYDAIDQLEYKADYSSLQIKSDMAAGRAGYTHYGYEEKERYAYYTPVGINNWFMMTIVPVEVVDRQINQLVRKASGFVVYLGMIMLGVAVNLVNIFLKSRKRIEAYKHNQLAMALEQEKVFKEVSYGVFDYVIEVNLNENTITSERGEMPISGLEWEKRTVYDQYLMTFIQQVVKDVYREGIQNRFSRQALLALCHKGIYRFEEECIIFDKKQQEQWIHVKVRLYKSLYTKDYCAILYINNIHEAKVREMALVNDTERDAMTALYNKVTTELRIRKILERQPLETHIFMICDIDDFKRFNDTKGHLFGDLVIKEVASEMKKFFRDEDIVGRIGGDEFVVFICHSLSNEVLYDRVKQLMNRLRDKVNDDMLQVSIEMSIGIAYAPEHGKTFQELYHYADKALYESKHQGKHQMSIYSEMS